MARFTVTYRLRAASRNEARARAEGIALEQTLEIPRDVVPAGYVEDEILGRVEAIGPLSEGVWQAFVSYSPDSAGEEFTQFLNVVFGNSSIQQGIRVTGIDIGPEMARHLPGPRFGIAGIRARCGRACATGPTRTSAAQPRCSTSRALAPPTRCSKAHSRRR